MFLKFWHYSKHDRFARVEVLLSQANSHQLEKRARHSRFTQFEIGQEKIRNSLAFKNR